MAVLTPSGGEQSPEGWGSMVSRKLGCIGEYIKSSIKRTLAVRVPNRLIKQGLSQKDFDCISKRFYEIIKGTMNGEIVEIDQQSATPLRDTIKANGWYSRSLRADSALKLLIGEFDLRSKPDVVAFLKDQFTPLPGGVSWQGMPSKELRIWSPEGRHDDFPLS